MTPQKARTGHGDHWLAALQQGDPRLLTAIAPPTDAPDGVALHRADLTAALDLVQVTANRRLVTAYPEPRATTLLTMRPRELALWDTSVEGWITADHEGAGTLTLCATDLAQEAERYQRAGRARGIMLEAGALAYTLERVQEPGTPRLQRASKLDARFLPDDYAFEGRVLSVDGAEEEQVLMLEFHGGLILPLVHRGLTLLAPGDHAQGVLWLTGRLPAQEIAK